MVRKPKSQDAARLLARYIKEKGIAPTVAHRQCLDMVALVDGYRSWHELEAQHLTPLAKAARSSALEYEAYWDAVSPLMFQQMQTLYRGLRDAAPRRLPEGWSLTEPELVKGLDGHRVVVTLGHQDYHPGSGSLLVFEYCLVESEALDSQGFPVGYNVTWTAEDCSESTYVEEYRPQASSRDGWTKDEQALKSRITSFSLIGKGETLTQAAHRALRASYDPATLRRN